MSVHRKSYDDQIVQFEDVLIIAETEKAVLCEGILDDREVWIPKSQVHDDSEIWKDGDEGTLTITRWFAEKEGLV